MPLLDLEATVVWALAALVATAVVVPYLIAFRRQRRADRLRLEEARQLGIDRPIAQFPFVDPASCIGCGACVRACPEGDVLGVVGGTAVVINGLRCVGHGRCADACPVGAIEIGVGDLKGRRDVPILTDEFETTVPGVFVAGELSGLALIRNAVEQGQIVVETVARRLRAAPASPAPEALDLLIVGAGPAGLSAALAAVQRGLRALVVDQSVGLGGTILNFPRRKMVLTRPVELPGGGGLRKEQYTKEEVLEMLGEQIERNRLEIAYGERLESLRPVDGAIEVGTTGGTRRARYVVLALGRRGTPRRLGVPGEETAKVMYQLKDAESYRHRKVLVVGGGDSAIEAAIGLARQVGNEVTISYRKNAFHRIKKKNEEAIGKLMARGRVRALFGSQVESIEERRVVLRVGDRIEAIANDEVFVLIGGEPPYDLLRRLGVAFGGDPVAAAGSDGGRRAGAVAALGLGLALLASTASFAQESPHGDLSISCDECHTTAEWVPIRRDIPFDHGSVGWPLDGMHAVAACAECHQSRIFSRVAAACQDCHVDAHQGELGLSCSTCHDTRRWDVRDEIFHVHATSLFPLLAGHARVDCEACHGGVPPTQYALTPTDCVACHRADYEAATNPPHDGFSTDCRSCHGPLADGWRAPGFAHTPAFPLTGAHAALACEQCHVGGTGGASADCFSCHRGDYQRTRDPNHAASGFPTTCQICHTTTAWEPASFNHDVSGFPLTGAHRTLDCQECHAGGYTGTPTACVACHRAEYQGTRDPNHAANGFPTTCQNCHTTQTWEGATFDHDGQFFPIYSGAHRNRWASCSTCHVAPGNFRVFECTVCHEHSRSQMDNEHDDVANYRYESRACYDCHPDGRE